MIWKRVDKETIVKTCFAIFPRKIGPYIIWFKKCYKTWDYFYDGLYSCYIPHYFMSKEKALKHVEDKQKEVYSYDYYL